MLRRFWGICHSLAHKLGSEYGIAHGVANAMLINQVIKFNSTDKPTKQGIFSQYHYPEAKRRYAEIAECLGLGGKDDDEKVANLIEAIQKLKKKSVFRCQSKKPALTRKLLWIISTSCQSLRLTISVREPIRVIRLSAR